MLKALKSEKWAEASALKGHEPLMNDLFDWMQFRLKPKDEVNFYELLKFIEAHKDWPRITQLAAVAEDVIPENVNPQVAIKWFAQYPPKSGRAADIYIHALLKVGQTHKAKKFLAEYWSKTLLSREEQKDIFARYKNLITRDTHRKRFDVLLLMGQAENALAIARLLGSGYPELAAARIAFERGKGDALKYLEKVPDHLKLNPGLMFEQLRWYRKRDNNEAMLEILEAAPLTSLMENPEEWWRERHILIRRYLEEKNYRMAYELARDHRQKTGFSYVQAEWLHGWLALRFMNRAAEAQAVFEKLYEGVETPISRSRMAYWAGQAAKLAGDGARSKQWLERAADIQTAYYGQLAAIEVSSTRHIAASPPPDLAAQDTFVFEGHRFVRIAGLLHAAGYGREVGWFLNAFIDSDGSAKAYRFAAEYASRLGLYNDALRIAKQASSDGLFLTAQAYPVISDIMRSALNGVRVEWALAHALIRQESLFDKKAQSHAGALGLMQLMPGTAKLVSKKHNIRYNKRALTEEPAYNISLGGRYLEEMLDRYDRSYPLAIAAYNAGPGRVDRWLEQFGDPRIGEVAMIDWIELIPIYETRNYVQRVTEGLYVYRLRFKEMSR